MENRKENPKRKRKKKKGLLMKIEVMLRVMLGIERLSFHLRGERLHLKYLLDGIHRDE